LIVGVFFLKNNILLLGGTGTLGTTIIRSKLFKKLKKPSSKELNILNQKKVEGYLFKNNINIVLHCAALARVRECERDKNKAFKINVKGTFNIVKSIINIKKKTKKKIKLIFISSDAVYESIRGNYKETDKLKPYNTYGKTKVNAERYVIQSKDYIIIRTRFFNKRKILFNYSATNIYTSSIEVNLLVKYIYKLIKKNFKGIINIGGKKISDYKQYKKYKKKLKPCDKSKVFDEIDFKIATDASLNLNKMKMIL